MNNKIQIWEDCCSHHQVIEKGVPLFENSGSAVETFRLGDLSAVVCVGHPDIKKSNKYSK